MIFIPTSLFKIYVLEFLFYICPIFSFLVYYCKLNILKLNQVVIFMDLVIFLFKYFALNTLKLIVLEIKLSITINFLNFLVKDINLKSGYNNIWLGWNFSEFQLHPMKLDFDFRWIILFYQILNFLEIMNRMIGILVVIWFYVYALISNFRILH